MLMLDDEDPLTNRACEEGLRIPLLRVLRAQWPQLPLLGVRVLLFWLLQLFLDEMRQPTAHPMDDSLVANASCWIIVGGTWAMLGLLHTLSVWCRTPIRQSRLARCVWGYVCQQSLLEDLGLAETQHQPWTLWTHMHASGLALFVLGYSLGGLFWLPQQTVLLASAVGFMCAHPPTPMRRGRWLGALGVACVSGLMLLDEALRTSFEAMGRAIVSQLWLGLLVPAALVWLLFASQETKLRHSDALVSFSLPSLMLIGLTYFSITRRTTMLMMVIQPEAALDSILASDPTVMGVLNATRTYYDLIAPSWLVVPVSGGGVLAMLMAPTLLWLCVIIVLRALSRSCVGSTMATYALSALAHTPNSAPRNVAIALLCLAMPLLLVPELRAMEEARIRASMPVMFVETHVSLPSMDAYVSEEADEHR